MRPLGALRDFPGTERGEPLSRLAAVNRVTVPESLDLRSYVRTIPDQGQTSSCVGQALAQCLRVRSVIQGSPIDPSAMAIYAMARTNERPSAKTLPDNGSYPARALEALSEWGVVAEARWPQSSSPTAPVPTDVYEAGTEAYVTGEYLIASAGDARGLEIRQAIAARHPVFFVMAVTDSYERLASLDAWDGMGQSSRGDHAQAIVGFDTAGVIVAGSWGESFGLRGFTRVAWRYVESPRCGNFHVVAIAPTRVQ